MSATRSWRAAAPAGSRQAHVIRAATALCIPNTSGRPTRDAISIFWRRSAPYGNRRYTKTNSAIGRTTMVLAMSRKTFGRLLAAGLAVTALPASAQNYPSGAVHMIVGYSVGGTGDTVIRIVSPKLQAALGQSVVG